jgi:hypothetical protein
MNYGCVEYVFMTFPNRVMGSVGAQVCVSQTQITYLHGISSLSANDLSQLISKIP